MDTLLCFDQYFKQDYEITGSLPQFLINKQVQRYRIHGHGELKSPCLQHILM